MSNNNRRIFLPARTTAGCHTASATVTKAKEEKSRRHGLRFFLRGQAPISIVLQRFGGLVPLWMWGSYPLTGSQQRGFCEETDKSLATGDGFTFLSELPADLNTKMGLG